MNRIDGLVVVAENAQEGTVRLDDRGGQVRGRG